MNVKIPENYTYIAAFLTLSCNLKCSYCINHLSGKAEKKGFMDGKDWIHGLNRLEVPKGVPITFQGGEPTIHPHFFQIIRGLREDIPIDILTNLQFNPIEFYEKISPERLKRDAKYASIRVTYHPETMSWSQLKEKVKWLYDKGYSICIYGILHPRDKEEILRAQADAVASGIEFRTKEFLGTYNGELFGNYLYKDSVFSNVTSNCKCKTSELLIGASGDIYRCHHDLYNKYNEQGHLLSSQLSLIDDFRICHKYGNCNPCDVKIKNNHKQEWGHTSVQIKFD